MLPRPPSSLGRRACLPMKGGERRHEGASVRGRRGAAHGGLSKAKTRKRRRPDEHAELRVIQHIQDREKLLKLCIDPEAPEGPVDARILLEKLRVASLHVLQAIRLWQQLHWNGNEPKFSWNGHQNYIIKMFEDTHVLARRFSMAKETFVVPGMSKTVSSKYQLEHLIATPYVSSPSSRHSVAAESSSARNNNCGDGPSTEMKDLPGVATGPSSHPSKGSGSTILEQGKQMAELSLRERALVPLQAQVRSRGAARRYSSGRFAVVRIQALCRGCRVRNRSRWRNRARREVEKRRREKLEMYTRQMQAAQKMQRLWRRLRETRLQAARELEERQIRLRQVVQRFLLRVHERHVEHRSARLIQGVYLKHLLTRVHAARRLQMRFYPVTLAKRALYALRSKQRSSLLAAVEQSSKWPGAYAKVRSLATKRCHAARKVQKLYRFYNSLRQRMAAKLQSLWRMERVRRQWRIARSGIRQVQRRWRGAKEARCQILSETRVTLRLFLLRHEMKTRFAAIRISRAMKKNMLLSRLRERLARQHTSEAIGSAHRQALVRLRRSAEALSRWQSLASRQLFKVTNDTKKKCLTHCIIRTVASTRIQQAYRLYAFCLKFAAVRIVRFFRKVRARRRCAWERLRMFLRFACRKQKIKKVQKVQCAIRSHLAMKRMTQRRMDSHVLLQKSLSEEIPCYDLRQLRVRLHRGIPEYWPQSVSHTDPWVATRDTVYAHRIRQATRTYYMRNL